jgi:hypothetical protein
MLRKLPLVLACGCSFLFTRSPETPTCSTSRAAPIVDTVVASLATTLISVGLVGLASGCKNDNDGICSGVTAGSLVVGGSVAAVYWPSAIVGYRRVGQCEDLQAGQQPMP